MSPIQCDLSNTAEVEAMFKWVESHPDLGGGVDVCIANAATSAQHSLLEVYHTLA